LIASGLGAHIHLCFDGQEPESAMHVLDGNDHLDHHLGQDEHGQSHNDVDVDVAGQALAKTFNQDELPVLALLWAWLLPVPLKARFQRRPARRRSDTHRPPRFWRPLLRAPP
jgi:hypothetical protein